MKRVARDEILDLGKYEEVREAFRRRIIELKRRRRVPLGGNMTVLFENHDTLLFQVQEMLRTERISKEDGIRHELDTYNELIPGQDELSATIFIEYPDKEERERMLVALAGIEAAFFMEVAGQRVSLRNETKGTRTDRTTAVHYVKVPLGAEGAAALRRREGGARLGVEHPSYRATVELGPEVIAELASDFEPQ